MDEIDEAIKNQCIEKVVKPCIRCKKPVLVAVDDPENETVWFIDCPFCIEVYLPADSLKEFILAWNALPR